MDMSQCHMPRGSSPIRDVPKPSGTRPSSNWPLTDQTPIKRPDISALTPLAQPMSVLVAPTATPSGAYSDYPLSVTMRFPCSTPFFLSVLSVGLVSAQDAAQDAASSTKGTDSVRLLQRIFHPSRPSEPFVDRGDILFSYPTTQAASHAPIHAGFVPSSEGSLQSYVIAFAEQLQTEQEGDLGPVDIESALYQLALAHPEHKHSTQWHVSSVKAVRSTPLCPMRCDSLYAL